jgi:Tol biopolymer transport system component
MLNKRVITSDLTRVLLIASLLCGTNVTPGQRLASSHNNRILAIAPTLVSAAQVSSYGLIAFTGANQIYVMNSDGSNVRRLTDGAPRVTYHYPAISPDGTRVAYIRSDESTHEHALYIVGIDGSGVQRLINGLAPLGELAWSPDGSRIAFIRGFDTTFSGYAFNYTCRPEIYVIDVLTRKYVSLTDGLGGTDPAWSPDGTRIAFNSFRDNNNNEIYTMSSDGKDVQRLTYTEWAEAEPAWSPDGKQIAYATHLVSWDVGCGFIPMGRQTDPSVGMSSIYVMEADGTNQTKLELTSGGNEPTWSPDGASLALVITDKNGRQIYVTDLRGTSLVQLTSDSEEKASPSWSNAGR